MSVPPPNYTQVPNVLLEAFARMPEAAVRVALVVARKTFGFHKNRDLLSLSQLVDATKLSRQGVINGIEYLETNGWVVRTPTGQSFVYQLLVNEVDQSGDSSSQLRRPELVNEVDRKVEKLVNFVDTQKKGEKKERKEEAASAAAPSGIAPQTQITRGKSGDPFCIPGGDPNGRLLNRLTTASGEIEVVQTFLELLPLKLSEPTAKTNLSAAREILTGGGTTADIRRAFKESKGKGGSDRGFTVTDLHSLKNRVIALAAERRAATEAALAAPVYTPVFN